MEDATALSHSDDMDVVQEEGSDRDRPVRSYAAHTEQWSRRFLMVPSSTASTGASSKIKKRTGGDGFGYAGQYHRLYSHRLEALRKRCLESAALAHASRGGNPPPVVDQLIALEEGVVCTVVGTVCSDDGYPLGSEDPLDDSNPLATIAPLRTDVNANANGNANATFSLEDESGRVELNLSGILPSQDPELGMPLAVAGVVLAVTGAVGSDGILKAEAVHCPTYHNNETLPPKRTPRKRPRRILLVSDLGFGDVDDDTGTLARTLLMDYVCGYLPVPMRGVKNEPLAPNSENDHEDDDDDDALFFDPSCLTQVIVAGGSCARPTVSDLPKYGSHSSQKKKGGTRPPPHHPLLHAVQELDLWLEGLLLSGVPVDLIPGGHDPTNANWPQQPWHPCLLERSCRSRWLRRSTNPYAASLGDGCRLVGTDGSNLEDVVRRFGGDRCRVLESLVRWAHLAPTAPDSLPAYPCPWNDTTGDPFVMDERPDVLFAGNCPAFDCRVIRHDHGGKNNNNNSNSNNAASLVVCVPSFAETREAVVLDIDTLECDVIEFSMG